MVTFDSPEGPDLVIDPIWHDYRKEIFNLGDYFLYPQTEIGGGIATSLFEQEKIQDKYLYPIIGMFIKATEVEQALKMENSDIFEKDPILQRIMIKSLAVKIEDLIKQPHGPDQYPYDHYEQFFNKMRLSLRNLDGQIENSNRALPNIIGSLLLSFDNATLGTSSPKIPEMNPRLHSWRERIHSGFINNRGSLRTLSTSSGVKDKFFSYLPVKLKFNNARTT